MPMMLRLLYGQLYQTIPRCAVWSSTLDSSRYPDNTPDLDRDTDINQSPTSIGSNVRDKLGLIIAKVRRRVEYVFC